MPKSHKGKSLQSGAPLNSECPICISIPEDPLRLPCNHVICIDCYRRSIYETSINCPLCNKRLSVWNRRLNASGGPSIDFRAKEWLRSLSKRKEETSLKHKHFPDGVVGSELKKELESILQNEDLDEKTISELSSNFATDIFEQRALEERITLEKEDENLARRLQDRLSGKVDRSKDSPDSYRLRKRCRRS